MIDYENECSDVVKENLFGVVAKVLNCSRGCGYIAIFDIVKKYR